MSNETIKAAVRERYAGFVKQNTSCCAPTSKGCGCSGSLKDPSLKVGYAIQDVEAVPEGANLGLGCGNPVALASLKAGEIVLDLGSGAGFDAFLASQRVGPEGRVIGVDMTPEMIARARGLAEKHGYTNVSFRQGDIEQMPVENAAVDVIISNCVINLTTDKARAFREAFRVLKPGGRLMVSDMVLLKPLPEVIRQDMVAYAACIAGALRKDDYLEAIHSAGFLNIEVVGESRYDLGEPSHAEVEAAQKRNPAITAADLKAAAEAAVSIQVQAIKPMESKDSESLSTGSCASSQGPKEETMSQTTTLMTEAVTELVAIGAAIASNCEPCFRHHYDMAHQLGVSKEDMREAVKVALAVKGAPHRKVVETADRYLSLSDSANSAASEGCACGSGNCI